MAAPIGLIHTNENTNVNVKSNEFSFTVHVKEQQTTAKDDTHRKKKVSLQGFPKHPRYESFPCFLSPSTCGRFMMTLRLSVDFDDYGKEEEEEEKARCLSYTWTSSHFRENLQRGMHVVCIAKYKQQGLLCKSAIAVPQSLADFAQCSIHFMEAITVRDTDQMKLNDAPPRGQWRNRVILVAQVSARRECLTMLLRFIVEYLFERSPVPVTSYTLNFADKICIQDAILIAKNRDIGEDDAKDRLSEEECPVSYTNFAEAPLTKKALTTCCFRKFKMGCLIKAMETTLKRDVSTRWSDINAKCPMCRSMCVDFPLLFLK